MAWRLPLLLALLVTVMVIGGLVADLIGPH